MTTTIFKRLKYRYRARFILLLFEILAKRSLAFNHFIGYLLGQAINFFSAEIRAVADQNLQRCFPTLSRAERRRIRRQSTIEMAKTMCEIPILWTADRQKIENLVVERTGFDHLEQADKEGRGIIMLSPHIGSWEILSLYMALRRPLTSMFRPIKIDELNELVLKSRQGSGAHLVPTDAGGVKKIFAALKRGEMIGILPDQDPGPGGGLFAPFFGIQTNTMTLCARLACKTQANVFLCWGERLRNGKGYRFNVIPIDKSINDCDEQISLTAMNRAIEQLVRTHPEQYQWSYRRFKTRPPGESAFYD